MDKKKILKETIENEDYPLYHRCGFNKFNELLTTNSITSRYWDNNECISCTRSKSFVVSNTASKYVNIKFNVGKLKLYNRHVELRNYSYTSKNNTERYEFEERICSLDGERFSINHLDKCIERIEILVTEYMYSSNKEIYEEIFHKLMHSPFYKVTYVYFNSEHWAKGITKDSVHFTVAMKMMDEAFKTSEEREKSYKQKNINYLSKLFDDEDLNAIIKSSKYPHELVKYFDSYENLNDSNKFIKISRGGKYNIIDWDSRRFISTTWYDRIYCESIYFFEVFLTTADGFNIIDHNGKLLLTQWYDDMAFDDKSGYIRVEKEDVGWNVIKHNEGKIENPNPILPQWYKFLGKYADGVFKIKNENEQCNIIDVNGNIKSKIWFDSLMRPTCGCSRVRNYDKGFNFIRIEDGELISPNLWFEDAYKFGQFAEAGDNFGVVKLKGQWYYIDKEGTFYNDKMEIVTPNVSASVSECVIKKNEFYNLFERINKNYNPDKISL